MRSLRLRDDRPQQFPGTHRFFYFICAGYDHRGRTVCKNNVPLPMDLADDEILTKLKKYVLDPDVVEGAIQDAAQALRPNHDDADRNGRR